MSKVIITVAQTGGARVGKQLNPNVPEQPDEIAQSGYECYNEGAAIVHIHARDKNGVPTGSTEVFKKIHELIRAKCNIILQDSTGGGANLTLEERIQCLDATPEMASLNMGTMLRVIPKSSGMVGEKYRGTVWINSREDIEMCVSEMLKRNIKPEMEVYHHGMLNEVNHLISKGLIKKPYYVNFVMGMRYQGAVSATPQNLITLIQLLPPDTIFNCCAVGAAQLHITTLSMFLGGMVRVGMEDNIYYTKGELAESNAQLVARTVRIARELGFEVASPDEAREILGFQHY